MEGIIVLDKPQDFTSFDAVAVVRGLTRERRIGHTGTLDPMATGVLPLLLGRATKAVSLLPETAKTYEASFRFGEAYTTGDVTGEVIKTDETPVLRSKLHWILFAAIFYRCRRCIPLSPSTDRDYISSRGRASK